MWRKSPHVSAAAAGVIVGAIAFRHDDDGIVGGFDLSFGADPNLTSNRPRCQTHRHANET